MVDEFRDASIVLLSSRDDLATDLIVAELEWRGVAFERLNLDRIPGDSRLSLEPGCSTIRFSTNDRTISIRSPRSIWYRRTASPQVTDVSQEAAELGWMNAERDAFIAGLAAVRTRWINHMHAVALAENKPTQLRFARELGVPIPDTLVTNDPERALEFAKKHDSLVAKSLSSRSFLVGSARLGVYTTAIEKGDLEDEDSIRSCPVILQQRIPRSREVRVTYVAGRIFATDILFLREHRHVADWHLIPDAQVQYAVCELPVAIASACRSLARGMNLVYATFDFVVDEDERFVFLEVNPSGQWGWVEHGTGQRITDTIVDALIEGEAE